MAMPQLVVYSVKDLEKAKKLFTQLLGADPYTDAPYYVGYRVEDREIGLDPNGSSKGPIVYWRTDDIATRVEELSRRGGRSPATPTMSEADSWSRS